MSDRPVPQPRRSRVTPTPAPRTRSKPSDDVLSSIVFSSPLHISEADTQQPSTIPPRERPPLLQARSNSNDYMEMKAPRSSYENVTLSSKPPNIPPPPLPDESTYDIPTNRISSESITNTTITSEIAPNITISSDDINKVYPIEDIYVPPGFNRTLSSSSSNTSEYMNISKLNNNDQRYNLPPVSSQDLENSNIKLLENIQIRSKPKIVENRALSPVYVSEVATSTPADFLMIPENVEIRSKNDETSRKPTESVLLNFDPLFESPTKKVSLNLLDDIFGALGTQYNGENACSLPVKQNLYDIAEGTEGYAKINKIKKENTNITKSNEKYTETGSNLVENSSKKDLAEKYGLLKDEYAEVRKTKHKEERESRAPTPPLRGDSIPREDFDKMEPGIMPRNSLMMRNSPESDSEKKAGKLGKFKSMKNFTRNILHKQNSNSMSTILQNCRPVGRPIFSDVNYSVHYTGVLVQPGRDRTEWGVTLSQGIIRWVSDKSEHELSVHNITSIAAFTPAASASSSQSPPMYCMELSSVNERGVQQMQLFSTPLTSLRSTWLQRILEATTSAFPKEISKDFNRAGWLNIKEGVSGSWLPCWMLLREREIFYTCQPDTLYDADLRKARCIIPQSSGGLLEELGCILLELHGRSLYLQAPNERDTNRWGHSIRAAAFNNGAMLHEQQLTKDNVPVIVEKCVNFVLQQGAISEGIYRRSGVQSVVSGLLQEFKKDAWSVQLSRTKYSEHEVATALKRFFKDLPEPLIALDLTPQLCRVAVSTLSDGEKVSKYRRLLQQLTPIHYVTSRKVFGHLHFLHLESKRNLMTARNLAAIWGISLMHQQPTQAPLGDGQSKVVTDLITLYPQLYDVAESEIARELQMLSVVERFHSSAPSSQPISSKPSGDLRLWITIGKPGSQDTIQIAVGPQKTAAQVCAELDRGPNFMLQEFVLGGALARVLHPSERVLEAVVRWGYWDDADRKDNQLVLAPCQLYEDIKPLAKPPLMACCELKFADTRSKNFKNNVMELSQAKLACYKDRKLSSRSVEWNIEDVVWYLGHEPKRDPQTKWSITFIPRHNKPKRSKEHPYFGHTMAGNIEEEKLYWCAAMFLAEHPEGL